MSPAPARGARSTPSGRLRRPLPRRLQKRPAQGVHRPLQRHIVHRLDFLALRPRRQILLPPHRKQPRLIPRRHRGDNMRSNPLFVDRLLPGGKIFCRGHAQGGSVGKRHHTLHRPLAESRFADKQCTAGVLERTRHNFRPLALEPLTSTATG